MTDAVGSFKSFISVYSEVESIKQEDYINIKFCDDLNEKAAQQLHIYITGGDEINPMVKEFRRQELFEKGKSLPRIISTTAYEKGDDIDLFIPEEELQKFLNFFSFYGVDGIIVDGLGPENLLQSVNGRMIYNHRFSLKQNITEIAEELGRLGLKRIMLAAVITGRGLSFIDECLSLIQEKCSQVHMVFDIPRAVSEVIEEYIEVFVFDGVYDYTEDEELSGDIRNIFKLF